MTLYFILTAINLSILIWSFYRNYRFKIKQLEDLVLFNKKDSEYWENTYHKEVNTNGRYLEIIKQLEKDNNKSCFNCSLKDARINDLIKSYEEKLFIISKGEASNDIE